MEKLIVHEAKLPTRCEICHQADEYDPLENICRRCTALAKEYNERELQKANRAMVVLTTRQMLVTMISGIVVLPIFLFIFEVLFYFHGWPTSLFFTIFLNIYFSIFLGPIVGLSLRTFYQWIKIKRRLNN